MFAVADIHGKTERLDYMDKMIDRHQPDVVVVAGDIAGWRRHRQTIRRLDEIPVPVLAVAGNSDGVKTIQLMESATNLTHLCLKRRVVKGMSFCGVGGAIPIPLHTRLAWREMKLIQKVEKVLGQGDILVSHCPPYGVQDRVLKRLNGGSKRLRLLIEARKPSLAICGHIHECAGFADLGATLVINCNLAGRNGGALVDIIGNQPKKVTMLKR